MESMEPSGVFGWSIVLRLWSFRKMTLLFLFSKRLSAVVWKLHFEPELLRLKAPTDVFELDWIDCEPSLWLVKSQKTLKTHSKRWKPMKTPLKTHPCWHVLFNGLDRSALLARAIFKERGNITGELEALYLRLGVGRNDPEANQKGWSMNFWKLGMLLFFFLCVFSFNTCNLTVIGLLLVFWNGLNGQPVFTRLASWSIPILLGAKSIAGMAHCHHMTPCYILMCSRTP